MSKELVLSTKDLTDVGISSQITSNDLIEVVAHDIYDKYVAAVNDVITRGQKLSGEYSKLMDAELSKMRKALGKYLKPNEKLSIVDDDEEMIGINAAFGTDDRYWPSIQVFTIQIKEKDKGTVVERNDRNVSMPLLKSKTTKVKLAITTGTKSNTTQVKEGTITGTIEETVRKTFTQIISVPITRFKEFANKVYAYNKEVTTLMEFLPKNGALSVERFTREARVKMNKKIISAQSPDFRKKMSELFNITL